MTLVPQLAESVPVVHGSPPRTLCGACVRSWSSPLAGRPTAGEGYIEQVIYDDAESLGYKLRMARAHGAGGVGLYQATGSYPDAEGCKGCMAPVWAAIESEFVQPVQ